MDRRVDNAQITIGEYGSVVLSVRFRTASQSISSGSHSQEYQRAEYNPREQNSHGTVFMMVQSMNYDKLQQQSGPAAVIFKNRTSRLKGPRLLSKIPYRWR